MAAANVSRLYGLEGIHLDCNHRVRRRNAGIGEAAVAIQRGVADVVLGGGCEAGISHLGLGGFNVIKALSRRNEQPEKASRPFDAKRDGFVPSEGAALLVAGESGARSRPRSEHLAEVSGYGVSSDAFHAVQPDEDGSGAARAMRWAIEDAGLEPARHQLHQRARHVNAQERHVEPSPSRRSSETGPTRCR